MKETNPLVSKAREVYLQSKQDRNSKFRDQLFELAAKFFGEEFLFCLEVDNDEFLKIKDTNFCLKFDDEIKGFVLYYLCLVNGFIRSEFHIFDLESLGKALVELKRVP